MSEPATIHLSRPSQFPDRIRKYHVHLDGARCGTISDDDELSITVAPGQHSMRLTIDWVSSNELRFYCGAGQQVHIECGNALGMGRNPSVRLLIGSITRVLRVATVQRDTYLYLKLVGQHQFHHHEDDVGMVQILPIEWWDYCKGEHKAIERHAEAHRDPDGAGWTKMYDLADPDPTLARLNMTAERFVELMRPHAKQFDVIENPLSKWEAEMGIIAIGFGPSQRGGIIADLDGDDVKSLWCLPFQTNKENQEVMAALLSSIAEDQHLMLVDWQMHTNVDLRERKQIDEYLFGD